MEFLIGQNQPQSRPQGAAGSMTRGKPGDGGSGGATGSPWTSEGSDQSFATEVLDASYKALVLIQFYATWCGPCKKLAPRLGKLVNPYKGGIRLVRIDIDKNPLVARQLRVQSVPMVVAFSEGRPIDGFVGDVPDSQLQAFVKSIGRYARPVPDSGDDEERAALEAAEQALEGGELASAFASFTQLQRRGYEPVRVLKGLSMVLLRQGRVDEAQQLLDAAAPEVQGDMLIKDLRSSLDIIREMQAEEPKVMGKLGEGADSAERFRRAKSLVGAVEFEDAVIELLEVVRLAPRGKDEDAKLFDPARQLLVQIFDILGPVHPLSKSGRRRLSSFLFS